MQFSLLQPLLFTITIPLVHTEIKNINNVFIGGISIVALIVMYFFVGNSGIPIDPTMSSMTNYSSPIIPTGIESIPAKLIEYSAPMRVNIESGGWQYLLR